MAIGQHLVEAGFVNEVVAWRNLGWNPRRVNVLLAHWTVGSGHFFYTLVGPLQVVGKAHVASVTMEIVASTTYPAYSASRTVKLLLVLVIVEFAVEAKVLSKLQSTFLTICLYRLSFTTLAAFNLSNIIPPQSVVLFFIVAESAPVESITARGHKLAFPSVMLT